MSNPNSRIEAAGELFHGHALVTTTVARLVEVNAAPPDRAVTKGVNLSCPAGNTLSVFVGGPAVTADSDLTSGGMPIAPGESKDIQIDDPSKLYVIVASGTEDIAWLAT